MAARPRLPWLQFGGFAVQTVIWLCCAVAALLSTHRDNLRGFFEYCFPLLLKKIFGYDDREASWLYTVAVVRHTCNGTAHQQPRRATHFQASSYNLACTSTLDATMCMLCTAAADLQWCCSSSHLLPLHCCVLQDSRADDFNAVIQLLAPDGELGGCMPRGRGATYDRWLGQQSEHC